MTEHETPPSVAALLLRLIDQQDRGFSEIRTSQEGLNKAVSSVDKDVALVKQAMDGMKDLPHRVGQIEIQQAAHDGRLQDYERRISANAKNIGDLLTDSNRLKGMSLPLGKVGVALVTAIIAGLVGAMFMAMGMKTARAADLRMDDVANQKCWAVPAKPQPKHLNV